MSKRESGIYVKKNKKGLGVYAAREYGKGEIICEMKGKKRSLGSLYHRKSHSRKMLDDPLQIGEGKYLDMDEPYLFFNHSCNPNAGIRGTTTLFALKKIKKGEEITFDYSTTIDESLECRCGSRKCRGAVADFFHLPGKTQLYYYKQGALPDFIRKKFVRLRRNNKN